MTNDTHVLSDKFRQAFDFAFELHKNQRRKGSQIPYIAHLLSVTAFVIEVGGDEEEAIAALLHDAVEDQGGLPVLNKIHEKFGEKVASIVEQCSDSMTIPKPPWRERKEKYIQRLKEASPSVIRVSIADKVHNLKTILWDYQQYGDQIWQRFKGGEEGTLWYYHQLMEVFQKCHEKILLDELTRLLDELDRLVR